MSNDYATCSVEDNLLLRTEHRPDTRNFIPLAVRLLLSLFGVPKTEPVQICSHFIWYLWNAHVHKTESWRQNRDFSTFLVHEMPAPEDTVNAAQA